jgi:hypothetical protein
MIVTALLVLGIGAGVAGCGSSNSSSSSATSSGAQFQARLNLAKCFRSHGVNVPDPSSGGGVAGGGDVFRILRNYSRAQIQAAAQACRKYFAQAFPRLNLSPAQRAQLQHQLTKFARCMRSHGVNVPDPTFNNGGGFGFRQGFKSVDRNSPAFKSALAACQSLRPRFGRGGGGFAIQVAPGGPGA